MTDTGSSVANADYQLLFDAHPLPMWVFEPATLRFLAVNEAALNEYGYARDEFLRMSVLDLRPPAEHDRLRAELTRVLAERARGEPPAGPQPMGVWTHRRKDGSTLEVELTWSPMQFAQQPAMLALGRDLTRQRRLERESRAAMAQALHSREHLDRTLRRVADGLVALDRQWRFTYVNARAAQMMGAVEPQRLLGCSLWDAYPQVRHSPWHVACEQALATQQAQVREHWFDPWGRWFESRIYPDSEGLSVYLTDITGRRQAERALQEGERRYRLLFERNPHPMWVFELQTQRFLAVNDAAISHYGYSREEFLGMTIADVRPASERDRLEKTLAQLDNREGAELSINTLWWHLCKDGRLIEVEITSSALEFDGRRARLVLAHDVTARREAERARESALEQALQSRDRLGDVMARVSDAFFGLDAGGRFVYLNGKAETLLGPPAAGWIGQPAASAPLFDESLLAACEQAMATQRGAVVERQRAPDGGWIELRLHPAPHGLSIYGSDITARREAEQALRDSERQFRLLAERIPGIVYRARLAPDPTTEYVSPRVRELGYTPEEWTADPQLLWNSIHPDDRERVQQSVARALASANDSMHLEYRMRAANGEWRYSSDHAQVVRSAAGVPTFILGVNIDATESRRAQARLQEALDFRHHLVEQLADGVLVLGPRLEVQDLNGAACAMLGSAREEVLGRPFASLLEPSDRMHFQLELPQLLIGQRAFGEWALRVAGTTPLPVEVSVRQLDGGRHLLVLRDVTERRAADRAQQEYRRELAALTQRLLGQEQETSRRLAMVLHDRLGQLLAAARLRLEGLLGHGAEALPAATVEQGALVDRLIEQALQETRQVLADLRPPLLEERGLAQALEHEVLQRQRDFAGPMVLLEVTPAAQQQRWPPEVEYGSFMIAREALINAHLHAGAQEVVVRLDGSARQLQLEVHDDGVGIPEPLRQGRPGHLGLVGMRERALAIGARFSVETAAGSANPSGTRVRLGWRSAGA